MNWDRVRRDVLVRDRGTDPIERAPAKPRGITNAQARKLAQLQRARGIPYTGSGMTFTEAEAAIHAARSYNAGRPAATGRRNTSTSREAVREG